jgi:hypothetical protein
VRLIILADSIANARSLARALGFNPGSDAVLLISTDNRTSLEKLRGLRITNRDTKISWGETALEGRYYSEAEELMKIALDKGPW